MSNFFQRLETLELSLAGKVFHMSFNATLSGEGINLLQIKTGTKKPLLLGYSLTTSAEPLLAQAYESPTVTDGTSAITAYNMKRSSTAVPMTLFYSNPTNFSGGTLIQTMLVTAGKNSGGSAVEGGAWQLKPSTSYIWKITNLTNQTTRVAADMHFAEDFGTF